MSLSRRSADMLTGLLVLTALGVLVLGVIFTQGWNERWIAIRMLTESAQDLNVDTKVYLQGLEIGRVRSVLPRPDQTDVGKLEFVATLRIRERFGDGTAIRLPAGTTAEVVTRALGGADVLLKMPARSFGELEPGDTIRSTRRQPALEAIAQVADSLTGQLKLVLNDTRELITRVSRVADQANGQMAETGPQLRRTLADLQATMADLRPALSRATVFMDSTDERFGHLHDSLLVTLSQTRMLMTRLDTLTSVATGVARSSEDDIRTIIASLRVTTVKMDHMMDQISRRPLKMITGVRPLPPESLPPQP